ncbi:MAG: prolipoprotein diacylglyceryl transferase [Lachnospiraceae bacterium]|nr:prolipoprotein diacylglyceryl transferase [Lachnospiraceae bacterium]
MAAGDIAFPNLGIYLTNVPKGIYIGNFFIALYGVIIAIGMILGLTLGNHESDRLGNPKDTVWELAFPLIFFSVLGARVYYVIFFWDYYKANPKEILDIRGGGLAIYGGVIVGFLVTYIFTRIKKIGYFRMMDCVVMGLLVGQIIGRWGNFTNREVFGGYTDNLVAMRLPLEAVRSRDVTAELMSHVTDGVNYIQVHPTFLYESVSNAILLLIMWLYRKHKKFDGEIMLMYLGGYGIIRFVIEGIRTDQLKIGHTGIAVSQMLGIILFVFAVICEIIWRIRIAKTEGNKEGGTAEIITEKTDEKEPEKGA